MEIGDYFSSGYRKFQFTISYSFAVDLRWAGKACWSRSPHPKKAEGIDRGLGKEAGDKIKPSMACPGDPLPSVRPRLQSFHSLLIVHSCKNPSVDWSIDGSHWGSQNLITSQSPSLAAKPMSLLQDTSWPTTTAVDANSIHKAILSGTVLAEWGCTKEPGLHGRTETWIPGPSNSKGYVLSKWLDILENHLPFINMAKQFSQIDWWPTMLLSYLRVICSAPLTCHRHLYAKTLNIGGCSPYKTNHTVCSVAEWRRFCGIKDWWNALDL